jgi:tetratricopeptide (TPR) repeat protein
LAGFIIGFIFANSVNRNVSNPPRPAASQTRNSAPSEQRNAPANSAEGALTEEEVREAIATADSKPENTEFQHRLGLALYQYANHTQDARYLPDVVRFLKRAYDANPKDRDLTVSLGNVLFDLAQQSEPQRFSEARSYYQKALEMKADDPDVRTDLGLTYYLAKPSEPQRAIIEYRKSLALDAKHEPTLQHLAAALTATGNHAEAQKRIDELQSINPSNPALPNLRAQLAQSKNAQE